MPQSETPASRLLLPFPSPSFRPPIEISSNSMLYTIDGVHDSKFASFDTLPFRLQLSPAHLAVGWCCSGALRKTSSSFHSTRDRPQLLPSTGPSTQNSWILNCRHASKRGRRSWRLCHSDGSVSGGANPQSLQHSRLSRSSSVALGAFPPCSSYALLLAALLPLWFACESLALQGCVCVLRFF